MLHLILIILSYIKNLSIMSKKLKFMTFNILEMNYYLRETIKKGNEESQQDCAKALIFLRRHLHEDLKMSISL